MKKLLMLALTIIMTLGLSACGVDDIDISGYADSRIIFHGLELDGSQLEIGEYNAEDDTFALTIAELKAMDCVTKKTHSTSDKIGEVKATGVELGTLLEELGCEKADFEKVRIKGSDEYDVSLNRDYITEHDIYLAFGINGEPLDAESAPCRIIIPESDSAYWTRMVTDIYFTK